MVIVIAGFLHKTFESQHFWYIETEYLFSAITSFKYLVLARALHIGFDIHE